MAKASLSIGIVGLPNVGKSTLFKLLTSNDIVIANYPFATINPNIGVVPVIDERLDTLSKMSNSQNTVPAVVEFYDIAGLVKGASTGAGLGNQFLGHIKDVSAVIQVLRCFEDPEIIHVENSVNPVRDMDIINSELALKDLAVIEARLPRAQQDVKRGVKEAKAEVELLTLVKEKLEKEESVIEYKDNKTLNQLGVLSIKPRFYLLNGAEENLTEELRNAIAKEGSEYLVMDLSSTPDISELTKKAYSVLGLISFFTTGEKETRAWTIKKGSTAPKAAGVIHTDFENKFIRAEVVSYDDFVSLDGWSKARQNGKLRTEGKEYVVQEADIMEILHS